MYRFAALAAFLLTACSPRPVVVRGVPEDSRVMVFFNLLGGVEVPPDHVYQTKDGLMAVEDLPHEATLASPLPLLAVEARRFDGCLLASVTQQSWAVTLRPVENCGRGSEPTPAQQPLKIEPKLEPQPVPPADRDGDGIVDPQDQCPDTPAGRFPAPQRPGCPDGDRDADGYPDSVDDCPDRPRGDYPGIGAGCPDTRCPTPAPDFSFVQPPLDSDKTPRIFNATPLLLPAGERRTIVLTMRNVTGKLVSVSNPASAALIVEKWSALSSETVLLQVKVRADAESGPLPALVLYFGSTRLELAGLEVVPAPVTCG